jgi:pseudaminic acid biosynthesis-associated methylase
MTFNTEQEKFWAGGFGSDYIGRNDLSPENAAAYSALWHRIIPCLNEKPQSALELGSNIGHNLRTLKAIFPGIGLGGVEINKEAAEILKQWGGAEVYNESILDFKAPRRFDLVFTAGVLIHINPQWLPQVYKTMYDSSSRYIIMAEYYNSTPVEVSYRGYSEKMYKRDFAGEIMDLYPDLTLRDYGFVYRRDRLFSFDDLNWFVMEKKSGV